MCANHYAKWRRWGDSLQPLPKVERICEVDGCENPYSAKGMCKFHYMRVWCYGSPKPDFGLDRDTCGTEASYYKGGCRCEPCREAGRRARKRWRDRASKTPFDEMTHGDVTTYINYKCRCSDCRDAWAAYRRDSNRERRHKTRSGRPYTAMEVFERDGWKCQICGKSIPRSRKYPHPDSASVDHILPLSFGGLDCATNVQASHFLCNVTKGNRAANDQLRIV